MPLKGRKNVERAIEALRQSASDDIAGVYLAGLKNMIEQTPAQSGGTRNSWLLSESPQGGLYNESSGSAPKADSNVGGSKSIMSVVNNMPHNVLGKTLYFVNVSPAINLLEYGGYPNPVKLGSWIDGKYQKLSSGGYSKQAPKGWVRKNLTLMRRKIKTL